MNRLAREADGVPRAFLGAFSAAGAFFVVDDGDVALDVDGVVLARALAQAAGDAALVAGVFRLNALVAVGAADGRVRPRRR